MDYSLRLLVFMCLFESDDNVNERFRNSFFGRQFNLVVPGFKTGRVDEL